MNEAQRTILRVAAVAVALMVVFPPYIVENNNGVTIMAGYGFLFDLPSYITNFGRAIPSSVNVKTLVVQVVGAVVVCGLAFLATKQEKTKKKMAREETQKQFIDPQWSSQRSLNPSKPSPVRLDSTDPREASVSTGGTPRAVTEPQWNPQAKPKIVAWKMWVGVVLLFIAGGLGVLAISVVRTTVAADIGTYLGAFAIPLIVGWWGVISVQSWGRARDEPVKDKIELQKQKPEEKLSAIKSEVMRSGIEAQFWKCLELGKIEEAKILIASHPTLISSVDADGNTPLHMAVKSCHHELAKFLMHSGADLNTKNDWGSTPRLLAEKYWSEEMRELFK